MIAGAASGFLASTGVGLVGQVAGNAAISMANNAADQVIENKGFKNFNVGSMLFDGVVGGIAGRAGGAGAGSKHLNKIGKQLFKRTFNTTTHKGLKAGAKEDVFYLLFFNSYYIIYFCMEFSTKWRKCYFEII